MKPKRNDPCFCGSGLKFKKCHGHVGLNDQPSANLESGYKFDPMASLLEQMVRPHLLDLKKNALTEWCRILDQWTADEKSSNEEFDTIRLERLINLALSKAQEALSQWDSRFALQAVRSLPHSVIANVCQLMPEDTGTLGQVIRSMSAVAASPCEVQWQRALLENGGTAIQLTPEQYRELTHQLPEIIGRYIGACNMLVWSQIWYRWAGKGRRIVFLPQRLSQSNLDAINRWNGKNLYLLPCIEWTPNVSIEQAVAAYDTRRIAQRSQLSRSGLLYPQRERATEQQHRFWHTLVRPPYQSPLPVHVPKLNITFPSPNWYPVIDTCWQPIICFLGKYFDPQLKAKFDLSAKELELCLAALGLVIEKHTQCFWLTEGYWNDKPACVLNSQADESSLQTAVYHLVSVLQRGTVRVQGYVFRNAVISELKDLGALASESLAHRFFKAFSGVPNPVGLPTPLLFTEPDEQTCIYDLTCWQDFLDGLIAIVTAGDGDAGNVRGAVFEEQVRANLKESLKLAAADDVPWTPNKDIWEGIESLID